MTTSETSSALVFIGPMAAGKTSVGRRVAKALNRPFIDTDQVIAGEHGPIADIFATQGEDTFRRIEAQTVHDVLTAPDGADHVVALGGGAILAESTRALLAQCRVVLLTVSDERVRARLQGTTRPLLADAGDAFDVWQDISRQRQALYEAAADVVFDTSSGPMSEVADRVAQWAETEARMSIRESSV